MARTAWRPTAKGELSDAQTLRLLGRAVRGRLRRCCTCWVNPLTMWLTFATFVGYAVIYTVILKPLTPQNIVIGGASGAMPPVLGWAAMRNDVGPEALMLFLIIFLWTPPHFWALALYRVEDYRKSGLPMLPVTHGNEFTRLQVLLYTLVLFAATLLPFIYGMSGWLYLAAAVVLGVGFIAYAWRLWRDYSDALARQTFRFSICAPERCCSRALLLDHYLSPWLDDQCERVVLTAGCGAGLADAGLLARPRGPAPTQGRRSRRSTSPAPTTRASFRCPTHDGKPRSLADFKGKVVVVFFGYTQCPDVCPTTHGRAGRRSSARWARTATSCRASSSPSIPSATRRRC